MKLKFVKKFIKLIKITHCVCGRICNRCDVAVVCAECVHTVEVGVSTRWCI